MPSRTGLSPRKPGFWWILVVLGLPGAARGAPATPAKAGNQAATEVRQDAFTNSLGMVFAQVPGLHARFSIWETRLEDYSAFAKATGHEWNTPSQGPTYPAVNVNWDDACAFCRWLTAKERKEGRITEHQSYRLPTDAEWTAAATAGSAEAGTPEDRWKKSCTWPWGSYWPPLPGDGNFGPGLKADAYEVTAPVGQFKANALGLYDLGGNVWEWCDDWYNAARVTRALRGGSWNDDQPGSLLTTYRFSGTMNLASDDIGFRVVLE